VQRVLRILFATLSIYLLAYAITALGVLLGCIAALLNLRGFIRSATVVWGRLMFWLVGRHPRVIGAANRQPGTPYLVVSNHASMFDIPALMAAVPGIAIMGRAYLTRIPGFGQLLKILHYVPIDTSSPRSARTALQQAAQRIRGGTTVGIFAEGTRTDTGQVQALKRGFVTVLRKSGADLLPVFVRGTFALQPRGRRVLDPREPISVTVGTPVANRDLVPLDDTQIMHTVRTILEQLGDNAS
jgi:1-acyl-sn-glycerol-3-phosphate acyltransferase